jgi:hypothetical protein
MANGVNAAKYGYSGAAWAAMTQAQRDAIMSGVSTGNVGGNAGFQMPSTNLAPPAVDAATGAAPVDNLYSPSAQQATISAPTRQLNTAPEWLAYLSALGLEQSQAQSDTDRMRAMYQSEADRLKQDIVPQYGQQRRGIAGSLETRGMARSGEMLRKLAENRAAQGRQTAGIEAGLGNQIGTLESQLAQKMAGLNSQRAQQELSLRGQGYV